MIFEGSGVALITPFNSKGKINYYMVKELIDFQISNGTNALIILGTTGESATISYYERENYIKFCVDIVNNKIPVIVGCGSNSTEKTISLINQAQRLGADATLIVTPYYNKCNQDGLYIHYKTIANASKIPIIIYNVPSRTGVNITPETVLKLTRIDNIIGIKEASGNLSQITKLLSIVPKNFYVYSGDDSLTYPMMTMGAKGVISVTANAYPNLVQLMCSYIINNNYLNALKLHNYLYKINTALFLDVNPICIKTYMNLLGYNVGIPRLPLTKASDEITLKLKEIKDEYEN